MLTLGIILLIVYIFVRHPALLILGGLLAAIGLVLLLGAVPGPVGPHWY
jgi:hypothetical protein